MNAMLHDIEGKIVLADTLSNAGKAFKDYDVILTNPPFGTKKGGERPTRDDLTYPSSNKQLNFVQVIYRSLRPNGNSRAAVVVPDNVLFQEGDGQKVRADLMNKCNLHTILRLPTGIFYAQGVKTNVLFFTREKTDKDNTKEVGFYDMRTNMPNFGVRTLFTETYFNNFELAYNANNRHEHKDPKGRWTVLTREQIKAKGDNLDQGLIADSSVKKVDGLADPAELAEEAIGKLEEAIGLLHQVVKELRQTGTGA
jgi:type I restriction enzyme M protein